MSLPDLSFLSPTNAISISIIVFLGFLTIFLSSKEDKMKKHLAQKEKELRLREDFTHMMVHELRSPLTAIKDSAELIISSRSLKKSEKNKLAGIIEEQAKIMLDTVSSILDAAKIRSGRFAVQKIPGDIKKTVKESINVFLPQAKNKEIKIATEFAESLPVVSFDPIRIEQVMNNLLSNSIKFTPEKGKITVSVQSGPAKKNNHSLVYINISDTGIGIPKEKQGLLFSKFSQVNQQNHDDSQQPNLGTGLGLYITKGIVEAHGGSIFLNSEEGVGTTISFTLPVH